MDPFIAEVKIFSGNFPPRGWAFCNGQLLPINQNQALFSLLGTTYGGNGVSTFALPNLQARAPLGSGQGAGLSNRQLGELGGEANHALTSAELPAHTHTLSGTSATASTGAANGNMFAVTAVPTPPYHSPASLHPMSGNTLSSAGGSAPHENTQPRLALNFIIALQGIFPSRN